jgi:hypothetical protein
LAGIKASPLILIDRALEARGWKRNAANREEPGIRARHRIARSVEKMRESALISPL